MALSSKTYLGLGTALGAAGGLATTGVSSKDDKSYILGGVLGAAEGASLTALPMANEWIANNVPDKTALNSVLKTTETLGNRSMLKNAAIYAGKGAVFAGALGYISGEDTSHTAMAAGIGGATWAGYGALMSHSNNLSVSVLTKAINKL